MAWCLRVKEIKRGGEGVRVEEEGGGEIGGGRKGWKKGGGGGIGGGEKGLEKRGGGGDRGGERVGEKLEKRKRVRLEGGEKRRRRSQLKRVREGGGKKMGEMKNWGERDGGVEEELGGLGEFGGLQ